MRGEKETGKGGQYQKLVLWFDNKKGGSGEGFAQSELVYEIWLVNAADGTVEHFCEFAAGYGLVW